MTTAPAALVERFQRSLAGDGGARAGDRVVVAVSGGLDSCVLLHLSRFRAPFPIDLVVAHYDHALRAESHDDVLWLRGLCAAWRLSLRTERSPAKPTSEEDARERRYAFLERVRADEGATLVMIAHHADDQAETVLFRILRGTGIGGLAAIPRTRAPAIMRPLLDTWRDELETYAAAVRITWREDATNDGLGYARNAIRNRLLPDAERLVAPGARRALVRLARLAEENEAAWQAHTERIIASLVEEEGEAELRIRREPLSRLDPALATRVLRALVERLGASLDEAATRLAVAFISSGRSGTGIDLGSGIRIGRALDHLVLGPAPDEGGEDRPLPIPHAGPGRGHVRLGTDRIPVAWGSEEADARAHATCLRLRPEDFPLSVRGRAEGDRIRLAGGTRKLKKVLLEARIPSERRDRVPVVVDAAGAVLWVPGVARAVGVGANDADDEERTMTMWIGVG